MFLGKDILKMYSTFTGENPCLSVISIKLLCKLQSCASCFVNLLHNCRTPFPNNTSGGLLQDNGNKISNTEEPLTLKRNIPIKQNSKSYI